MVIFWPNDVLKVFPERDLATIHAETKLYHDSSFVKIKASIPSKRVWRVWQLGFSTWFIKETSFTLGIKTLLDSFTDPRRNRLLALHLLDLILVLVFPELQDIDMLRQTFILPPRILQPIETAACRHHPFAAVTPLFLRCDMCTYMFCREICVVHISCQKCMLAVEECKCGRWQQLICSYCEQKTQK